MYRETWFEINLDAIEENVHRIKEISGKKLIAVLKANAYGCGDIQISQAVMEAGADMIAVSSLDEAMVLREAGYEDELMIVGPVAPKDVSLLIEHNIICPAFSLHWLKEVISYDVSGLKVHIKIDSGMNRIGFKDNEELLQAKQLMLDHGIIPDGVFTHFACADTSREMTDRQFLRFAEAVRILDYPFRWIHCDNSDASLSYQDPLSNACRVGIALYGISSFDKNLSQALSLYSVISHVKKVPAGETIGYGATYRTTQEEWIGTVPIGYADGFVRANQGRYVFVEGTQAEVVGRVCMDQCMIRLDHPRVEGSTVELFGPHIPLQKMAEELHTIPYEVICLLSARLTRVYRRHGREIGEYNLRLFGNANHLSEDR